MTVHNDDTSETKPAADADLILRTRSGDGEAFGELWRRHYPSGIAVARSVTSSIDPDDLVQESYARIYQAVLKGGGPHGSFRAYLFTSIRNTAAAWGRTRRETAMDELETVPDPDSTEQAANDALDRGLTAQAFRSLPTRWQEVLWYSEIEQMKPAEIGPLLGMKAGAVSQLAFRAREGLREAWVQAHLRSTASDSECHWTIERLGAYSRGNVSARDRARIDAHLEDCSRCLIVAGEADEVSSRLALVLLPLVLGVAGASGYAAMLHTGGVPAVAVAAMPSSVVAGGVVVTGAASAGLDAAASAASSSSAGGGATGGAITSIGALVGAGSAALVVAGVVAAATIVPGLLDASPVTSLPSAGDADSSSISSDVTPDGSIESGEKLVLEVVEPPKQVTPPRQSEPVAPPSPDELPEPEASAPPAQERPSDHEGNDGTEPTEPTDPTDPGDPGDGGETDPGDVGETDPGDGEDTGPGDPEEPTLPAGIPSWSAASVTLDGRLVTHYTVPVSGASDATVRALLNGSSGGGDEQVLDAEGQATLDLRPTLSQLCRNATVTFQYVAGDLVGETATTTLYELSSFRPPKALCFFDLPSTGSTQTETVPPAAEETVPPAAEEPVEPAKPADDDATLSVDTAPADVVTPVIPEPTPAEEAIPAE